MTTLVWNIIPNLTSVGHFGPYNGGIWLYIINIQIQHKIKQFLLGQEILPFENSDHDFGDMTLGEGHDTPFGHGAIEWNIQTEHENKQLWPRQGNSVCVYCGMILLRLTVCESLVNVPLLGSVIWNTVNWLLFVMYQFSSVPSMTNLRTDKYRYHWLHENDY